MGDYKVSDSQLTKSAWLLLTLRTTNVEYPLEVNTTFPGITSVPVEGMNGPLSQSPCGLKMAPGGKEILVIPRTANAMRAGVARKLGRFSWSRFSCNQFLGNDAP
jgi:hypothetical protein